MHKELRELRQDNPEDAAVRKPLVMALFNAITACNNLDRPDAFPDEMRKLQQDYPQDAVVRDRLAKGVVNTQNSQQKTRQHDDALLEDLRRLQRVYPEDPAMHQYLAMGCMML